ncbi:MAG TPA: nitrogenase-stabilizing/protective protein NifW [Gallionellaceae bacterium]|nr:nitrogenase-stabilizing/protective protein NifW [Gallionellaceae bacterium]
MSTIINTMAKFSSAEEFLNFFEVAYDQRVVNINRLHILKRFQQYIARHTFEGGNDEALKAEYRTLLERSYGDFAKSNAATEKVFKVFQEAEGVKVVTVDSLRASLPGRGA